MPVPTFSGLPPFPTFDDHTNKINKLTAELRNLLLNLDSLNIKHLTADVIDAGTINANVVTIRSDLSGGAYVQIDGNGMVINNGSYNTFTADINGAVTMTSALIQSSPSSYPRVVMDPASYLFRASQTLLDYAELSSFGTSLAPELRFSESGGLMQLGLHVGGSYAEAGIYSANALEIAAPNVYLTSGLTVNGFDRFSNGTTDLQSLLDGKAHYGALTSAVGNHDHGIPAGTLLAVSGGGSVTWVPSGGHSHTQL